MLFQEHRQPPELSEDETQTTTNPPSLTIPTVCASKDHFASHPAIFIHRLPSPCALVIDMSTHTVLHRICPQSSS